jgi:hypothetical protein
MRLLPAALLGALAAASAWAEEQPVVIELFTSQGCTSCPPADAMMAELARMDGVIALSLHVDYWDYIGWPDAFASPEHTARQEAYAHHAGERMVYTPQALVNGEDRVVGSDAMALMERLRAHSDRASPVSLRLTREGGTLVVEATAEGPVPPLTVHLVGFVPERRVDIAGGENAGLSMTYANVVTSWETLGTWTGEAPLRVAAPLAGAGAVLLQEEGPGAIRAAALAP